MRRRALGLLFLTLAGCHNPVDDLAKLDLPNPSPAAGWVQIRHEPGGYAFQAPKSWTTLPLEGGRETLASHGIASNLYVRLTDPDAAHRGDFVSFAVTRLAKADEDEVEQLGDLKVQRLDEIGEKALKSLKAEMPNAQRERIDLPIGKAEHLWGTVERAMPDGKRQTMSSHMVAFATALRPFVLVYLYPADKEAEYRPTLDAMVRSVRLFRPKKEGKVSIPVSVIEPAETFVPAPTGQPGAPNPATSFDQGVPPTSPAPTNVPSPASPGPSYLDPPQGGQMTPSPGPAVGGSEPPVGGGSPPVEPPPNAGSGSGDPGAAPPASGSTGP